MDHPGCFTRNRVYVVFFCPDWGRSKRRMNERTIGMRLSHKILLTLRSLQANAKSMREYLEKEWKGDLADDDCVELCVKTLLEVVDSGAKNMEVVVLKIAEDGTRSETTLPDEALDAMCARIEREREEGKDEGKDEMKD